MKTEFQGKKYTLILEGNPTAGISERTVGMHDDESEDYNWKQWDGLGKIIDKATTHEIVFSFETQGRKSHTASVMFKRDNYSVWDASLEDFILQTEFDDAESATSVVISDKEAFVDMLCQNIVDANKKITSEIKGFLKFIFKPTKISTLVKKGIIAELTTKQVRMSLET
jgi:hypothetical protein